MDASYDLSKSPASFNFVEFLAAATTLGADNIVIDLTNGSSKFSGKELEERIHSILIPACKIAGVGCEFSHARGIDPGYHLSAVLDAYAKTGRIKKLVSSTKIVEKYTVTLRNCHRHIERNTDDSWVRFAKSIGARIIHDYYDVPISLEERFALYAGAEMNFFCANGPLAMCLFSDYPYRAFIPAQGKWTEYHKKHGWYKIQLPWASENQTVVWSNPDFDSLCSEFS